MGGPLAGAAPARSGGGTRPLRIPRRAGTAAQDGAGVGRPEVALGRCVERDESPPYGADRDGWGDW